MATYNEKVEASKKLGRRAAESYCKTEESPSPEEFYEWFSQSEEWNLLNITDGTGLASYFWNEAEKKIEEVLSEETTNETVEVRMMESYEINGVIYEKGKTFEATPDEAEEMVSVARVAEFPE